VLSSEAQNSTLFIIDYRNLQASEAMGVDTLLLLPNLFSIAHAGIRVG